MVDILVLLAESRKMTVLIPILGVMCFVDKDESCSSFYCRFLNNRDSQGKLEQTSYVIMGTTGLGWRAWQYMRSLSCELQAAGRRL